jgi:hypothetical protein
MNLGVIHVAMRKVDVGRIHTKCDDRRIIDNPAGIQDLNKWTIVFVADCSGLGSGWTDFSLGRTRSDTANR